jgi:LPXTG-motif cell wall-anchored protein
MSSSRAARGAFTGAATLPLLLASGLLMLVGTAALAASRRRWRHHR